MLVLDGQQRTGPVQAPFTGIVMRLLRDAHGLTQEEAAKTVGIHPITLSNYETGKRTMNIETLQRLCELYG